MQWTELLKHKLRVYVYVSVCVCLCAYSCMFNSLYVSRSQRKFSIWVGVRVCVIMRTYSLPTKTTIMLSTNNPKSVYALRAYKVTYSEVKFFLSLHSKRTRNLCSLLHEFQIPNTLRIWRTTNRKKLRNLKKSWIRK